MNFKGKKILVMGLGLHGGALSLTNWLMIRGAKVRITDEKTKKKLLPSLKRIQNKNVKYTLGRHKKSDFLWADIVVQNPAVPKESPFLRMAKKNGATIENEATLFFKLVGREKIVGITGTRGKSTTAYFTYQLLKKKFPKVLLGGNIAVSTMFDIVDLAMKNSSPVILELSSWHLENLGDQKLSPRVSCITNLMADHLNRYKNIFQYHNAKKNIMRYQTESDLSVINFSYKNDCKTISKKFYFGETIGENEGVCIADGYVVSRHKGRQKNIFPVSSLKLEGSHLQENVLAAVCIAKALNVSHSDIKNTVPHLQALPHRQEKITTKKKIHFINDTSATTPDATMAALKTYGKKKNIILIAGGSAKKIPQQHYSKLGKSINRYCNAVVLFFGDGSVQIKKGMGKESVSCVDGVRSMTDAVGIAFSFAKAGDIVLLSPASASFNMFDHEFDRGRQFVSAVYSLS